MNSTDALSWCGAGTEPGSKGVSRVALSGVCKERSVPDPSGAFWFSMAVRSLLTSYNGLISK